MRFATTSIPVSTQMKFSLIPVESGVRQHPTKMKRNTTLNLTLFPQCVFSSCNSLFLVKLSEICWLEFMSVRDLKLVSIYMEVEMTIYVLLSVSDIFCSFFKRKTIHQETGQEGMLKRTARPTWKTPSNSPKHVWIMFQMWTPEIKFWCA